MTNEDAALQMASNRKQLKAYLTEIKLLLVRELREGFGKGAFDFENRRLIGDNGIILQWKLRQHPDQPESYPNQQTRRGYVAVQTQKIAPTVYAKTA